MPRWTWCLLIFVLFAAGCDLQRLTVDQTADILHTGSVALDRESDPQFAREALPASLKTLETFLVSSPDNRKLLELVARGYYSYAFGFLEGDLERAKIEYAEEATINSLNRRAVLHYLRSREYGFRLLDKPALKKAAEANDIEKLKAELKKLEKEDVPGLFWAGFGWASAINLSQDNPDLVAGLGTVEVMMKRVEELDENYFDGGIHLFFGVFYASRPEMYGGKPEEAKKHFDRAMEMFGTQNLMIPFLYARFYAPQVQDKELFATLLHQVATANMETEPDRRLNNEIAAERARFWLEHADELIFE